MKRVWRHTPHRHSNHLQYKLRRLQASSGAKKHPVLHTNDKC